MKGRKRVEPSKKVRHVILLVDASGSIAHSRRGFGSRDPQGPVRCEARQARTSTDTALRVLRYGQRQGERGASSGHFNILKYISILSPACYSLLQHHFKFDKMPEVFFQSPGARHQWPSEPNRSGRALLYQVCQGTRTGTATGCLFRGDFSRIRQCGLLQSLFFRNGYTGLWRPSCQWHLLLAGLDFSCEAVASFSRATRWRSRRHYVPEKRREHYVFVVFCSIL